MLNRELAPGPTGLPFLGVAHHIARDTLGYFQNLQKRYGDVVRFRIGNSPCLLVSDPDHIKHVLQKNPNNYTKGFFYRDLKPLFGTGVLTAEGATWAKQRQTVNPAFRRSNIEFLTTIMGEAVQDAIARWQAFAEEDRTIDISEEMSLLTGDIIVRTMFGSDISYDVGELVECVREAFEYLQYKMTTPYLPKAALPLSRTQRFRQALRKLDHFIYEAIHIRQRERGSDSTSSLLSMLVNAMDKSSSVADIQQIRDEAVTIFIAGHETTALALTWSFFLLNRNPQVLEKLEQEIDQSLSKSVVTNRDLESLSYTKVVLQESMRLYPPVFMLSRTAIKEDRLGEYIVRPKDSLLLFFYNVHRDPRFWEEPSKFIPERFEGHEQNPERDKPYFPFSIGPRTCLGKHFAMVEGQIVLASLLKRFSVECIHPDQVLPFTRLTLRPKNGIACRIRSRVATASKGIKSSDGRSSEAMV